MWNIFPFRKKLAIKFLPVFPEESLRDTIVLESDSPILLPARWYFIKFQNIEKISDPFLLLDVGVGFKEDCKFPLNCINNTMMNSVAAFPDNIKKIRLVFQGSTLPSLVIHFIPISKFEAFIRVGVYLLRLNKLRGISTTQVLQEKWHQIRKAGIFNIFKNLDGFYDYGDTTRPIGYRQWIKKNERYDDLLERLSAAPPPAHCDKKILVYVILEKDGNIEDTANSLVRQFFCPQWHFLLITTEDVLQVHEDALKANALLDQRITIFTFSIEAANQDLFEFCAKQQCHYVMRVNPGDTLPPLALYFFMAAAAENPDADLLYCDSDVYDKKGKRINPHFRPAWNRELFYSQNYISNCALIRFDALKNKENRLFLNDTAVDAIALQAIEAGDENRIIHIPQVLYHRSGFNVEKDTLINTDLRKRMLQDHFHRMGRNYDVEHGLLKNTFKIVYPIPSPPPHVTLIIPTCDSLEILKKCISSILALTQYSYYDIIIVDNNSQKPQTIDYFRKIKEFPNIRVLAYPHVFNFAAINNFAVTQTTAEFICLLNNDVEIFDGKWLEEMIRIGCRDEIGCVGAKLLYGNGKVQHAGIICGLGNVAGHAHRYFGRHDAGYFGRLQSVQQYSAVTAACLLVRRKIYLEVGGMNERLAVAYNDVDFCLKVKKAGYKNVYTPFAELYHHESLSRGPEDTFEKQERYKQEVHYMWTTWKPELQNDRCYNPNLSRLREDFSL